jgi:ElaB/YqjD/DUF883 family membrane-anchored ribosome-binding protein
MLIKNPAEPVNGLAGQAAQSADRAIRSTQRAASEVIDSVANAAQEIREDAVTPLLNRAADRAGALANRSVHAVREGSRQARARAQKASATTAAYVREEPVKSMLLAAATGAALLALFSLLTRSRVRLSQKP